MMLMLAVAMLAAPAQGAPDVSVKHDKSAILAEYTDLLAIPNVATNVADIRRNAEHIMSMMARRGLSPRLLEGDNANVPPAIYGEWLVPGAQRTLVLYAHYDGQPVTPEDWKSTKPFEPKFYSNRLDRGGKEIASPAADQPINPEWRIYARSASDDKLGVMAILQAVSALKAQGKRPAYNLKIFFEGEEEMGSPNLGSLLARHRDTLKSDGWVIFDGPSHPTGAPQVSLGVRGDVNVDVIVHGPVRPLHSGHYGNWVPNPAMVLSQLLATMKDKDGRVTVAGFYDDVIPLTEAERLAIRAVPSADAQLKSELGLGWTEGSGMSLLDAIQQPSLNINGIRAADVGDKARNVIPTSATASLDLRLVKGNDSKRQVEKLVRHIQGQGFLVLDREPTMAERQSHSKIATVVIGPGYNAERTTLDDPLARMVAAAVKPHGAVVLPSLGGSLPLYIFRETLGAPTVSVALANYDNNQHAEDENLRIGNLWRAIDVVATVMQAR
jgi:acetylornithine deacetylase/succinyl-diaminopimelate desuccinylase-like protein